MRTILFLLSAVLLAACADDDPAAGPRDSDPVAEASAGALVSVDTATAHVEYADSDIPTAPTESAPAEVVADAPVAQPAPTAEPVSEPATTPPTDRVQVVAIAVGADGFEPQRLTLEAGVPARLVFTRTAENTCATEVVVPDFDVGPVTLPLGTPVAVEFTPSERGEFGFACGMGMFRGALVVGS